MTNDGDHGTGTTGRPDAQAAILAAYHDQSRWLVERRTDLLDALLSEAFTAVHIGGYEQSKVEWLEQIRSGQMAYHHVQDQSVAIEVDGDTAVLRARSLVEATIYGSHATWPLAVTTMYVNEDGRWRPARSQATTF